MKSLDVVDALDVFANRDLRSMARGVSFVAPGSESRLAFDAMTAFVSVRAIDHWMNTDPGGRRD